MNFFEGCFERYKALGVSFCVGKVTGEMMRGLKDAASELEAMPLDVESCTVTLKDSLFSCASMGVKWTPCILYVSRGWGVPAGLTASGLLHCSVDEMFTVGGKKYGAYFGLLPHTFEGVYGLAVNFVLESVVKELRGELCLATPPMCDDNGVSYASLGAKTFVFDAGEYGSFVKLDKNMDGSYQYIPAGVWELCLNGHKFAVCREVEEI